MKILVVYSTYGGVAKSCAEMLQGNLEDKNEVTLVNIREENAPSPEGFDAVILGSSIRMSVASKKIKKYAREYRDILNSMPCAVYFVCGYTKRFSEYADTQMPKGLEPSLGFHLFGGELKPDKLHGFDRLVVKYMRSAIKSQDFEEEDSEHHDLPEIIPENILLLVEKLEKEIKAS